MPRKLLLLKNVLCDCSNGGSSDFDEKNSTDKYILSWPFFLISPASHNMTTS